MYVYPSACLLVQVHFRYPHRVWSLYFSTKHCIERGISGGNINRRVNHCIERGISGGHIDRRVIIYLLDRIHIDVHVSVLHVGIVEQVVLQRGVVITNPFFLGLYPDVQMQFTLMSNATKLFLNSVPLSEINHLGSPNRLNTSLISAVATVSAFLLGRAINHILGLIILHHHNLLIYALCAISPLSPCASEL